MFQNPTSTTQNADRMGNKPFVIGGKGTGALSVEGELLPSLLSCSLPSNSVLSPSPTPTLGGEGGEGGGGERKREGGEEEGEGEGERLLL